MLLLLKFTGQSPVTWPRLTSKGERKFHSPVSLAQNNEWTTLMTSIARLLEQLMRAIGGGRAVRGQEHCGMLKKKSTELVEIGFYNKLLCYPKFFWALVSLSMKWSPGPFLDEYFYFTFQVCMLYLAELVSGV